MANILFWPSFLVSFVFLLWLWPWALRTWTTAPASKRLFHKYLDENRIRLFIAGFVNLAASKGQGKRWILGLVWVYLSFQQLGQYVLATSLGRVDVFSGFSIDTGSSALFPLTLAVLMYAYLSHSPQGFRWLTVWLFSLNAVIALATWILREGWLIDPSTISHSFHDLWSVKSTWKVGAGFGLLVADVFLMIGFFSAFSHQRIRLFPRILGALLAALTLDATGFSIVIWLLDGGDLWTIFREQFVTKYILGIVYAVCLSVSVADDLRRLDPIQQMQKSTVNNLVYKSRNTRNNILAMFFSSIAAYTVVLVSAVAAAYASGIRILPMMFAASIGALMIGAAVGGVRRSGGETGSFPFAELVKESRFDLSSFRTFVVDVVFHQTAAKEPLTPSPEYCNDQTIMPQDENELRLPTTGPNVGIQQDARRQFAIELTALLANPSLCDQWVAYTGSKRLDIIDESRERLYRRCVKEFNLRPGQFTLFRVEPVVEVESDIAIEKVTDDAVVMTLAATGPNVEIHQSARRQFAIELTALLANPSLRDQWVAYTGSKRLDIIDESRERLYRRCVKEFNLRPGQFTLFRVAPAIETEREL